MIRFLLDHKASVHATTKVCAVQVFFLCIVIAVLNILLFVFLVISYLGVDDNSGNLPAVVICKSYFS